MSTYQDKAPQDIQRAIDQLWSRMLNHEQRIGLISNVVDLTISTRRIVSILEKTFGHSSAMPDHAGNNEDHDQRYPTRQQVTLAISGATAHDRISLTPATELTIAAGVVTAAQSLHTIDTEGDGASDDLDTINGFGNVQLIALFAAHTDRSVVIKHGTGNIVTGTAGDYTLDNTDKVALLVYHGSAWHTI